MARQASVLIADEIYYNLHGKAILQGIYNTDLTINVEGQQAIQLVFLFVIETDINDPFRSIQIQVTLPGNAPVTNLVPVFPQPVIPPGRTKSFVRWPMMLSAPILRSGKIEAKVIHESGEILVAAPWITGPDAQQQLAKPN